MSYFIHYTIYFAAENIIFVYNFNVFSYQLNYAHTIFVENNNDATGKGSMGVR